MMVARDDWPRIRRLVEDVIEMPAGERVAYLDRACAGDAEIRSSVDELLQSDSGSSVFLEPPWLLDDAAQPTGGSEVGRRVGAYRITEFIATGGMGEVYLAVRDDDAYRQRVAVKLIRGGMVTTEALRRFHRERQVLASLEHPNITRLLDGGTTDDGLPFIVMEYVDGRPINCHCEQGNLSIRERIELFLKVCAAVQFAHRNLFVHRDLKPGNILVGDGGTPKLLDFGVSKLLEDEGASGDDATQMALRPLTPRYSSPEHILGEPITTVSDVYCLGIILYELLTGRLPFESDGTIAARLRSLESQAPARPSLINPRLCREIDSILLKAIARDPEQRFQSVEALSDDLCRYLSGDPVTAHDASRFYGLRKLVARHRLHVGLAAFIVVFAMAFGAVATRQAFRLNEQRRTAVDAQRKEQQAREAAEEINQFLGGILEFGDPIVTGEKNVSLQAALDEAGRRLQGSFADHPEIRAKLHTTLGKAYFSRGLLVDSQRHLRSALETRTALSQEDDLAVAESLNDLARVVLD